MLGPRGKEKGLQAVVDRIPITHSVVDTPYIAYAHARSESPSLLLAKKQAFADPVQTTSRNGQFPQGPHPDGHSHPTPKKFSLRKGGGPQRAQTDLATTRRQKLRSATGPYFFSTLADSTLKTARRQAKITKPSF